MFWSRWPSSGAFAAQRGSAKATYVGSKACERCHTADYNGWKQTRMANVVRDPKAHPEGVLGDFTHPDPVRTFDLGDVAFTYGSRWKQRYFTKRGADYFVEPRNWDVKKVSGSPFHVEKGTDWWVPFYGETNFDRPTGPYATAATPVNYNIETKQPSRVECGLREMPRSGQPARRSSDEKNIVNPGALDWVRSNDAPSVP